MIVDGRTLTPPVWFPPSSRGTRPRKTPARVFVWHWSAGSRGVDGIGIDETLIRRHLSIHYVLERDGRIVMTADPATTIAYHAGKANRWSIGCEIVGGPGKDFTPAQYASIGELAEASGLPRVVFDSSKHDLATFRGHCEHRNITPKKIDAGGRVLRFLAKRWAVAA